MSFFSFDATAGTSQSTAKPRLKGNEIYELQLDGVEVQDIQGVKDTTKTYKTLKIKFSNENGTFEHTVFEPQPDDFKRGEREFKNKNGNIEKIPQPSNVETMMLLFKHIIDGYVPAIAAQIDKKEKSLGAKSWDELRKLITAILEKGKGNKNTVKLLRYKDEARFPGFFAGVTKEGVAYVRNNFIGPKVAFTAYELTKMREEESARPTDADTFEVPTTEEPDTTLDLGFELD